MNIPLSIYDEIIRDKTALWAIYEKGGLEPVFFKIVPIVPPNGIGISMDNNELIQIPSGRYGQTVTSRKPDGTLTTHSPIQEVDIERITETK